MKTLHVGSPNDGSATSGPVCGACWSKVLPRIKREFASITLVGVDTRTPVDVSNHTA